MPAGNYDITIEQGATFSLVFTWRDSAGSLVNVTGYSARMQVRKSPSSPTVLLDLSTTGGGITLGGTNGTITLSASAATTAALSPSPAVYDLEMVSPGGVVTRLLAGKVNILPEVTR